VKEQKDKKTNETISFEMEGEVDDQPFVSCGAHYMPTCEDCPHSLSRPDGTSPRLWCNGDCIWKNERCRKKSTKKQVNCGGHSADTCEDCTEAGEGNRNWCNGECTVKCLKGENRGCSEPSEWSCVSKDSIEKPEDSSEEVIDPEPSGKSGPLRIERKGGKCLFSCENDGGCKVGWYNYKDGGYGHFFCSPKSSEDGGKCELSKLSPKFCRDCHGTRKRNKYAPCKEPKPVVTCDYSCVRRVCYVKWSKKKGKTTSWGVHPHWNATVPEKCKDKCTKQFPGCEFRLKF